MSFWIEDFYLFGCLHPWTLFKQALCKPYVYTADGEKRASPGPDHLCSGVGYQKGLLEALNLSQLVLERKTYYDYPKGIQVRPVNLLSSNVSLPDAVAEFLSISRVHCMDFATVIRAAMVLMAIVAVVAVLIVKLSLLTVFAIETIMDIETVMSIVTNMTSS